MRKCPVCGSYTYTPQHYPIEQCPHCKWKYNTETIQS